MTATEQLIERLCEDPTVVKPLGSPAQWGLKTALLLVVYFAAAQWFLGVRPDLTVQLSRPFYVWELLLLASLALAGALACVMSMYPDSWQKPRLIELPFLIATLLAGTMAMQLWMQPDPRMNLTDEIPHGWECVLCIGALSILPSMLFFSVIRQGANARPVLAGALAILTASALGLLALRIAEAYDGISHLLIWHYAPTIGFAALGAWLGERLLRW